MEQKEAQGFADALAKALIEAVVDKNKEVVTGILSGVVKPILDRLELIGQAQVTLAAGLRQARRDRNATEMAKVVLQDALNKGGLPDQLQLHLIADTAYAIANEMEVHALVAEVQSATKKQVVEKAAKENPTHEAGALALKILQRSE